MKIREVIVVEGKNDTNVLRQYFDCETIETHGTSLDAQTLELIRLTQARRGVIIFTDPDHPGEYIRRRINEAVPGCKNAFIEKDKAKTPKKVGVEHASRTDLEEALNAAQAIGDDRLQQQSQGRVVPDSFTHGTSQQRYSWFKRGFDSGDPAQCNTFGKSI